MYSLPPSRSVAQLVELGVVAGAIDAAVAERERRLVDQRGRSSIGEIGRRSNASSAASSSALSARGRPGRSSALEHVGQPARASRASAPSSRGVARPAAAWPASRSRSRTPSSASRSGSRATASRDQRVDGIEPRVDRGAARASGASSQLAQQARAHRRDGAVEHLEQRASRVRRRAATRPARGCGASSRRASMPSCRRTSRTREVRQAGRLQLAEIARAARPRRRSRRDRPAPTPRPSSEATPKLPRELFARELGSNSHASRSVIEQAPSSERAERGQSSWLRAPAARAGVEPRQRVGQRGAGDGSSSELAGREIDGRDADRRSPSPLGRTAATIVVARAGRASSSASSAPGVTVSTTSRRTIPFASLRIFDLLADRDAISLPRPAGGGSRRPPSPARRRAARRRPLLRESASGRARARRSSASS